jgi:taurine dioxygenase
MAEITVRPLTPTIGAEVSGVDLGAPLSDDVVATLRQALLDHLVLFFRDQDITPAQQLAFAERFAPVMLPMIDTQSTEQPGVTVLDQTAPRGQYTERWHSDSTNLPEPPLGAILRAVQLPSVGGDTCWASMYGAYETLSRSMQQFLEGLTAEHSTAILDAALAELGHVVRRDEGLKPSHHPVVRVHPETGRRLLFVNGNFTTRIDGLSPGENDVLLRYLLEQVNSPDLYVRFHWEPASVAFWDNRCTQHCAIADYTERRVMHRCLLRGDGPRGVHEMPEAMSAVP